MTASRTRATNTDRLADLNLQSCPGMAIRCPSGNTVHRTGIGLEGLAGGPTWRSPVDAADGSSGRHASATDSGADRAPTIWRSYHADDHDNRTGYCEVSF